MTNLLFIAILFLPIVSAPVVYFINKKSNTLRNLITCAITFITFISALFLVIIFNEASFSIGNISSFGISFSITGFNSILLILTTFLWLISSLFSNEYFAHYKNKGRFFFFWLITLSATCGVFLSDNFYTAFLFFEIMSFASMTWVIHEENEVAFDASSTYLTVSLLSGLVMLMGLFMLYNEAGTLNFEELHHIFEEKAINSKIFTSAILILFGYGAKAGLFPLHIWLPKAHPASPAPASSLLSGILTKCGIFGIVTISSKVMFSSENWGKLLLFLATITMTLGAILALFSTNLKRTLACSSMSQIGFIVVGISMYVLLGHHGQLAVRGIILHIFNHSLIKLVLFTCAGIVYMNIHKLELNDIRGYGRNKPLLMISFLLAALSIGGIPGFSGYISKTLLHESIVEYAALVEGGYHIAIKLVEYAFLFTGGLTLAYMTKIFICLFIDKPTKNFENKKYVKSSTGILLFIISIAFFILGSLPYTFMDNLSTLVFPFFNENQHFHEVNYFSWVNISGALISISIALIVYFLFVRKVLLSKEEGYKKYNGVKIDIEKNIYKPLLIDFLPWIFSHLSALFANNVILKRLCAIIVNLGKYIAEFFTVSIDLIIIILRKSIFKEIKEKSPHAVNSFSAYWGGIMISKIKYHHPSEQQVISNEIRLAKIFRTAGSSYRKITLNFSFAMLMACIGICVIFAYLLFV